MPRAIGLHVRLPNRCIGPLRKAPILWKFALVQVFVSSTCGENLFSVISWLLILAQRVFALLLGRTFNAKQKTLCGSVVKGQKKREIDLMWAEEEYLMRELEREEKYKNPAKNLWKCRKIYIFFCGLIWNDLNHRSNNELCQKSVAIICGIWWGRNRENLWSAPCQLSLCVTDIFAECCDERWSLIENHHNPILTA